MKKLYAGIFATVLGLSCLTACGGKNNKVTYDVEGAADFLDAIYVDQIVDGRTDYEVVNSVAFQGANYAVEWAVDVDAASITLVKGETTTKVDVNEASTADVDYVLTATVKDPNGNAATVKFYATLLKMKGLIPVAITAKPEEGKAYKYYTYQSTKKIDCYFSGLMSGFYFATTEDYDEAVDIYVEYVENDDNLFNLYFEHSLDGKQYIGVQEGWNGTNAHWTFNVVYDDTAPSSFAWDEELQTITTTVPCRSDDDYSNENATEQPNTKTLYIGNYSSYATLSASTVDKAATSNVGNLVSLESAAGVSAEEKIAFEKDALLLEESYRGDQELEVLTYGKRYPDVKIDWTVSGDNIAYADGKLTITAPTADTTVTVTATFTLGETTATKEFPITLKPAINVPEAGSTLTIPEAIALGEKFEKNTYTEGKYYVTGIVKSVTNTAYGNLYIQDEDGNELYIYGLGDENVSKYEEMTVKPVEGDTITVYGVIGYYSSAQMKNATMTAYTKGEGSDVTVPTTPEEILTALYALSNGESLSGPFTLTGKITALDTYKNPTIVVEGFEDKPVYCYKLSVTNVVGDTITVTAGSMKNYDGTYEFMDCTLVTSDEGGEEVTPSEIATLTIAQALELGATYAHDTYSTDKYYVSGRIIEVQNTKYGNMLIADENGNSILIYGLCLEATEGDDILYEAMDNKPLVGDSIKVLSVVGMYNSAQLKNAYLIDLTPATDADKVWVEKEALTLLETTIGATNLTLAASGENCTDVAITWTLVEASDIASISEGKLVIVNPAAEMTVSVKATLTCGEAVDSKTFTILVKPSAGQTWKMVTDVSQLTAGSQIIIAAMEYDYAIGDNQKTNNREQAAITKADGSITYDESVVEVLTLCAGNQEGTFAFQVEEGGYLYAASSSKNYLRTEDTLSDNSSWSISIAADGVATVIAQGTNTRNTMQYNQSSSLFACYASASQKAICIYIYA